MLTIFFIKKNREKKNDKRPIMTELIGNLDQMFVYDLEVDQDEVSIFDGHIGSIRIPESIPNDIYKLIGILESFVLTSEHKAIEILVQSPFHKIPTSSQCKPKKESEILKKFGLVHQGNCAKSPAFALSEIEYQKAFIEDIINNDDLTDEDRFRQSCDALNAVIVLLSDCDALPIQTLLPKEITCGNPYIIYQSVDGFYLTKKITFQENFCKCGRDRPNIECCKNKRCECIRAEKKCNERCQCHHCQNIDKKAAGKLLRKKTQTCKCGRGGKRFSSGENCVSGRCVCYKSGWGCDDAPRCICRNCFNTLGEKIVDEEKDNAREDLPKHHGKLRALGSDNLCYSQEGIDKKDSKWTDEETLALFIIEKYFKTHDKVLKVYNYIFRNMPVLKLREKTSSQIYGKMVNIKKYMCLYHTQCQHVNTKSKQ